jgi:hypothetical protein
MAEDERRAVASVVEIVQAEIADAHVVLGHGRRPYRTGSPIARAAEAPRRRFPGAAPFD